MADADHPHLVINTRSGEARRFDTEQQVALVIAEDVANPKDPLTPAEEIVKILTESPDFETAKKRMADWVAAQQPVIELK